MAYTLTIEAVSTALNSPKFLWALGAYQANPRTMVARLMVTEIRLRGYEVRDTSGIDCFGYQWSAFDVSGEERATAETLSALLEAVRLLPCMIPFPESDGLFGGVIYRYALKALGEVHGGSEDHQ